MFLSELRLTITFVLVPETAPDQFKNVEPDVGFAISVTFVFSLKSKLFTPFAVFIPSGELVIDPVPEPIVDTINVLLTGFATPPSIFTFTSYVVP